MEKRASNKKFTKPSAELQRKRLWKKALKNGVCPFGGCDISKATCRHLDSYLEYDSEASSMKYEIKTVKIDVIDRFAEPDSGEPGMEGAWALYKRLKAAGIRREMIQVLFDVSIVGKTLQQVKEDRGWTSYATLWRAYKKTLAELKGRGFANGE